MHQLDHTEKATFAAGCFWGIEAIFRHTPGIINTSVGYMGGRTENPTYKEVCSDKTGHAEVVEVEFDPAIISYEKLLEIFWNIHNPTSFNRQGPDIGTQYRSAIFYHNETQAEQALQSKENMEKSGHFKKPIVTEIVPAKEYYLAEEYHQNYCDKNGVSCPIHSAENDE